MPILNIAYASENVDGKVLIHNSKGDKVLSDKPKELLDFLGKNYDGYVNRKVAWNIDLLFSSVFKKMGLGACEKLVDVDDGRVCFFKFEGDNLVLIDDPALKTAKEMPLGVYRFIYNPKTIGWLSIGGVRYASFFNNTGQYFDNDDEDNDLNFILTKQAELEEAMFKLNLNPMRQASPAKIWEETVLKPMLDCNILPIYKDIPLGLPEDDSNELLDWCEKCMNRIWSVAYAVGHYEANETWDYDLSSAYAYALSQLKTFKYATFQKSTTMVEDADCGVVKGKITIGDIPISPIAVEVDGRNEFPVKSTWEGIFSLSDIKFLKYHGIGEFELEKGYFWKYPQGGRPPFGLIVPRFYDMRWQGGTVQSLAKKILSSAWGKFIWKKSGSQKNPYYNPIFAMQVQTTTRLRVAHFIYSHKAQNNVIHIGTDGVRLSKKIEVPDKLVLGGWKLNKPMPCIVLSPGSVYAPDKKPGGLYYDDVVSMIKAKPRGEYYTRPRQRRRTLSEAVAIGDINEVGEMRDYSLSFHVTSSEHDHISCTFKEYPTNGAELLAKKYQGESVHYCDK